MDAALADWRTAPVTEPVRAMLGFLEKLTLMPSATHAEDIEELRAAGIPARGIEEALYVCFQFNVIDRLADAFAFDDVGEDGFRKAGKFLYRLGYGASSIPG